jgi:3-hydroxy-5-methyl-1-naphthoate 3-O-methyltransferase
MGEWVLLCKGDVIHYILGSRCYMNNLSLPVVHDKLMWDMWMSTYHLPVISVADELGVFDTISKNKFNINQLAAYLEITSRAVAVLVDPLISLGFLNERNNNLYLSQTSETYLLSESPFYWGVILEINQRDNEDHKLIMAAIRDDGCQLRYGNQTITAMWQTGSMSPEVASQFTKRMHATIFAPAVMAVASGLFNSTQKLLDVGGGSGCFSGAYIKKYPQCEVTVFELPAVCDITKKYIKEYGLTEKIALHAGDFFNQKAWPGGHDGVLLSQILHDWSLEDCKKILRCAYESLPVGGKVYIYEMILDKKESSLTTAYFDLVMFISHKSQQLTKSQLNELLEFVGFKMVKIENVFGYFSLITGVK